MKIELEKVQTLMQSKKYKEASFEATKYVDDSELGNTFASILAVSLRMAEMYKELVDCYERIWKVQMLPLGNWDIRHYAYALRKCERYSDALKVCSDLKERQPNFKPILSEYYWNIYYTQIKKKNISEVEEEVVICLAKEVRECFKNDINKKFTPFALTMLFVAELFYNKREFKKCIEWLSHTNPIDFGKNGKFEKEYEIIIFEPHRAKYYKLYSGALMCLDKNDEAKNVVIAALNEYPFWLKMSEKLLSIAEKEFNTKGKSVFDELLSKIGFLENQIKQQYLQALLGKRQEYAQNWENNFDRLDSYSRNFQVLMLGRVLKRLFNEILIKGRLLVEQSSPNYENISASEFGDFVFCPASYALQKSMIVEKESETDIELSWSEKRLLIDRFDKYKVKEGINSVFSTEEIERIGEFPHELDFILKSKILQESKRNKSPKIFFNDETKFSGIPDYWLENGIKYVVEEKFTRYSDKKKEAQIEFQNHRAEILGQIIELKELNAKKGFVIYWLWSFEKVEYGGRVSTRLVKALKY